MKYPLDTHGLTISRHDCIAAAAAINRAIKAGRVGLYGNRFQVTLDTTDGRVWASEDTSMSWTVDKPHQRSFFTHSPTTAQDIIDHFFDILS